MTTTSRKLFDDCKHAHQLLELENNEKTFKLLWVAGCALLRSIGHVLQKVDAKDNIKLKAIQEKWWVNIHNNRDKNLIFFEFINIERNNLLKEYLFNPNMGKVDVLVEPLNQIYTLSENLFCPMSDGLYEGEDCRDIMLEAIEWWTQQLNYIDDVFQNS
jgi:hypothetical protein